MKSGHFIRRLRFLLQCAVLIAFANSPAGAATNVVTTLADSGPGSLREAISNALSGDTIIFSTNGTIALTNGELVIAKSLDIVGLGATNTAVSGGGFSRVFNIPAGVTSIISGVTIRDGRSANGLITSTGEYGGGVYNSGVLTLDACAILANQCGEGGYGGSGGGIFNGGVLKLNACTLADNRSGNGLRGPGESYGGGHGGDGGGICNTGTITILNCAIYTNRAGDGGDGNNGATGQNGPSGGSGGSGGGLWNNGSATITVSRLAFNVCGNGGAGGPAGRSLLLTVIGGVGGIGGHGGGIANYGTMILSNCAISKNVGGDGGHGGDFVFSPGGSGGAGGGGGGIADNTSYGLIAWNCTISGNVSGAGGRGGSGAGEGRFGASGGGVTSGGAILRSCTVVSNSAGRGGAGGPPAAHFLETGPHGSGGTIGGISASQTTLQNSVVALNFAGFSGDGTKTRPDIDLRNRETAFVSEGHNLIGIDGYYSFARAFTNGVNGDRVGTTNAPVNPVLGPLADNGGPTLTHALLPGSPAIDAGDDSLTGTDQRGRPRLSGAHVDIGAFEFQVPSPQNPGVRKLTNGTSQFSFTSFSDTTFSVLTATNVSLPSTQWVNLGPATLITNGFYEFTEPLAASNRHRFFQLRWP